MAKKIIIDIKIYADESSSSIKYYVKPEEVVNIVQELRNKGKDIVESRRVMLRQKSREIQMDGRQPSLPTVLEATLGESSNSSNKKDQVKRKTGNGNKGVSNEELYDSEQTHLVQEDLLSRESTKMVTCGKRRLRQ